MKNYETLQDCIEQIEMSDYECEGGYLKNNVAFIRLKEMAQVNNLNLPVVSGSLPEKMFNLKLHEGIITGFNIFIMRVPGGWMYDCWDIEKDQYKQGTFVPLNNEFVGGRQ